MSPHFAIVACPSVVVSETSTVSFFEMYRLRGDLSRVDRKAENLSLVCSAPLRPGADEMWSSEKTLAGRRTIMMFGEGPTDLVRSWNMIDDSYPP